MARGLATVHTQCYNSSINKQHTNMNFTNLFNSAAKSKTIAPVYTASNNHRVSFLSSIHGYVAGRKWYNSDGVIYIQSTRSQQWIPYENQYKFAVIEALSYDVSTSQAVLKGYVRVHCDLFRRSKYFLALSLFLSSAGFIS